MHFIPTINPARSFPHAIAREDFDLLNTSALRTRVKVKIPLMPLRLERQKETLSVILRPDFI